MKLSHYLFLPVVIFISMSLVGCGAKDYSNYAQAVKEQNITMQLMADKKKLSVRQTNVRTNLR